MYTRSKFKITNRKFCLGHYDTWTIIIYCSGFFLSFVPTLIKKYLKYNMEYKVAR